MLSKFPLARLMMIQQPGAEPGQTHGLRVFTHLVLTHRLADHHPPLLEQTGQTSYGTCPGPSVRAQTQAARLLSPHSQPDMGQGLLSGPATTGHTEKPRPGLDSGKVCCERLLASATGRAPPAPPTSLHSERAERGPPASRAQSLLG